MATYSFKSGPLIIKDVKRADPQRIGNELHRIASDHDGRLRPRDVWLAAQNVRNPLHRHIEWDKDKAARAHQLSQVRELIQIIRVVDDEAPTKTPTVAYVNVVDRGGAAYRYIREVRGNGDLAQLVLEQADRDLEAWQRRHADLIDAVQHVERARTAVRRRSSHSETRAAP